MSGYDSRSDFFVGNLGPTVFRLELTLLGFGVPYFNTFFLKGTLMK